jgi:hypothetical protein
MENNETIIERFSGGFFHAINGLPISDELFATILTGITVLGIVCALIASDKPHDETAEKVED